MHRAKLLILTLFLINGCTPDNIPVNQIVLSEELIYMGVGDQIKLKATVVPWNASDKTLVWSSGNVDIAQVDNNGIVRALKTGKTEIYVYSTDGKVINSCAVTVVEPSLTTVKNYTLAWGDEFDDIGRPDPERWNHEKWPAGVVNHELQSYVDDSTTSFVSDGKLRIKAFTEGNSIISARLYSRALFRYGYFEAKLKIPKGKGTWPAFWLMGIPCDWPLCGEVDIMEAVGHMPTMVHSNIWSQAYSHNEVMTDYYLPTSRDEFHIYAAELSKDAVRIYVDNILVNELTNDNKGVEYYPYNDKYQYTIVLNLAFGGDFGGAEGVDYTSLPAIFEIDYVRVFEKRTQN